MMVEELRVKTNSETGIFFDQVAMKSLNFKVLHSYKFQNIYACVYICMHENIDAYYTLYKMGSFNNSSDNLLSVERLQGRFPCVGPKCLGACGMCPLGPRPGPRSLSPPPPHYSHLSCKLNGIQFREGKKAAHICAFSPSPCLLFCFGLDGSDIFPLHLVF